YLVAWDEGRNNWRTFRVDRIQSKLSTGSRFVPRQPPEGDFAAYVTKSVAYAPYPHQAKVKFRASAEMISQRIPAAAGVLEAVDEGTCTLCTGASSLDMLSVYLALVGVDFEVLEPPELIERVRWLAGQFTRAVT